MDKFLCERFQCEISVKGCLARQNEAGRRILPGSGRKAFYNPSCADCEQGKQVKKGVVMPKKNTIVRIEDGKVYRVEPTAPVESETTAVETEAVEAEPEAVETEAVEPVPVKSVREIRTCKQCGLPKDMDEFGKNKAYKDGRETRCKSCRRKQQNMANARAKVAKRKKTERILEGKGFTEPITPDKLEKKFIACRKVSVGPVPVKTVDEAITEIPYSDVLGVGFLGVFQSKFPEQYEALRAEAARELRSEWNQALWILKEWIQENSESRTSWSHDAG